jgi:hypothetical protein
MGGGNSFGYLYGSYPLFGDGLHLGYNFYANPFGDGVIIRSDGPTSRISVGYGSIVLATGGVGIEPTNQLLVVDTGSVTVNGTFNNNSDRNAKQDFAPVSPAQILDKVAQLPLSQWSYKTDPATRHVGPTAQDFHSAFNFGADNTHISPIDEGGVALAAIQGLNQKLCDELKRRDAENAQLKHELENLKQRVDSLNRN